MSVKRKKGLLIAAVSTAVAGLICLLLLSLVYEGFLLVGTYCLISAMFLTLTFSDVTNNKNPKFLLIGIIMMIVGLALSDSSKEILAVAKLLSAVYASAGFAFFLKGIRDIIIKKHKPEHLADKPLPYIGIGLFVCGLALSVTLIRAFPLLLGLGHTMVVAGPILASIGIKRLKTGDADRLKKQALSSPESESTPKPNPKSRQTTVHCRRCGSKFTLPRYAENNIIYGGYYCDDCMAELVKESENNDTVCSVCGAEILPDAVFIVNDEIMCQSCFSKKISDNSTE